MRWIAEKCYEFLYWVMNDIGPDEFTDADREKLDRLYNKIMKRSK